MERLLLSLLETSAAVGVIVLALTALSPLLNKVLAARWKYGIWLLLAVRLLIPWNPDLPALPLFSRLPAIQVELPALSHRPGPVQDDEGGGRGGGPLYLRVTDWSQEGDLLSIFYEEYDGETGAPFEDASYLLQIRLAGDGSFRYLSNQRA